MNFYYFVAVFVILIIDIMSIYSVFDTDLEPEYKILWMILILILPIIGAIVWFVMKPKKPDKYYSEPTDLL